MRWPRSVLTAAAIVAATLWLYAPALGLGLAGDDYQWVQHAHRAMHRPALLLADLDTFYRPTSTWTLALDRLLWGHRASGYHLTNVFLHAAAGVALAFVARRLGLRAIASCAVGLLWALSPFTDEPAISVAIRFEDLLLLAWLGTILAWPGPGGPRARARWLTVATLACLAALSKETWIVTPALVVALEWAFRRIELRRALRNALPFAGLAAAYAALYFAAFPGGKSYFEASLRPLLKVPYQFASFLYLVGFVPVEFPFSVPVAIGFVATAALVAVALIRREAAGVVGSALLVLPTLPTLLVPFLPTRYTAIPYAGFLLLVAAGLKEASERLGERRRIWVPAGAAALAAAVLVAGGLAVRADLADARRVSEAHRALLDEARAVAGGFPSDRPVLVLREEATNPLASIATAPIGLPKLLFVRHLDPYGLVDAAALFEWVIAREDVRVARCDDGETRFAGRPGAVLAHRAGAFAWRATDDPDLGARAKQARLAGVRCRVVVAEAVTAP